MKRLLMLLAALWLSGCATYNDPHYSDRYYDRGYYGHYHDRYGHGWRSPWYYDLYDPYSAMFHPLGYFYDPWGWNHYYFGVNRYSSRYWNFSFYGGRPWFHSPWYGGYGIYYPYGYRISSQRPDGRPSRPSISSGGQTAQQAASGMAAEIHGAGRGDSLVRSSAVRVDGRSGNLLLGSMVTPVINHRVHVNTSGSMRQSAEDATATAPGTPQASSLRSRMEPELVRQSQHGGSWRDARPMPAASGWEGPAPGSSQRYRTPASADHPWRDSGSSRSGSSSSPWSSGASRPGPSSAPARSYSPPAPAPRASSPSSGSAPARRGGRDHD